MMIATEIATRLRRIVADRIRCYGCADDCGDGCPCACHDSEDERSVLEAANALDAAELALKAARDGLAEAARQRASLKADVATLAGRIDAAQVALLTTERERDEARVARSEAEDIGVAALAMVEAERDEARAIARRLRCDNDGEDDCADLAPLCAVMDGWPDGEEWEARP